MKKHLSDIIRAFCFALLLVWGSLFPPISSAGVEITQCDDAQAAECKVTFKFLELFR